MRTSNLTSGISAFSMTLVIQPVDLRIIRALKQRYCRHLVCKFLQIVSGMLDSVKHQNTTMKVTTQKLSLGIWEYVQDRMNLIFTFED
jgi:hypothetical protein